VELRHDATHNQASNSLTHSLTQLTHYYIHVFISLSFGSMICSACTASPKLSVKMHHAFNVFVLLLVSNAMSIYSSLSFVMFYVEPFSITSLLITEIRIPYRE
jgi:hypothetical protein